MDPTKWKNLHIRTSSEIHFENSTRLINGSSSHRLDVLMKFSQLRCI